MCFLLLIQESLTYGNEHLSSKQHEISTNYILRVGKFVFAYVKKKKERTELLITKRIIGQFATSVEIANSEMKKKSGKRNIKVKRFCVKFYTQLHKKLLRAYGKFYVPEEDNLIQISECIIIIYL